MQYLPYLRAQFSILHSAKYIPLVIITYPLFQCPAQVAHNLPPPFPHTLHSYKPRFPQSIQLTRDKTADIFLCWPMPSQNCNATKQSTTHPSSYLPLHLHIRLSCRGRLVVWEASKNQLPTCILRPRLTQKGVRGKGERVLQPIIWPYPLSKPIVHLRSDFST